MPKKTTPQTTEYATLAYPGGEIHIDIFRMRRKTCTVSVLDDGRVTIKCPPSMTKRQIDKFLELKRDWIVKHYTEIRGRMEVFKDVMDYRAVLIDSKPRPLVTGPRPGIYLDRVEIHTRDDIGKVFIKEYGQQLTDFAWELAKRFNVQPKSITVKGYKSRWGCCDIHGNIVLNYALMMLSQDEQALVIIHEFCHLTYMDHSKEFHALLDRMYPGNRLVQKKLNAFSFLLRLYN